MSKNFSLAEMIASDTARRRGIDNTPSFEVVSHLDELCNMILQPLRDAWGKPIIVTSGYRCTELNKVVGGTNTSVHRLGWAADLQPSDMRDFDKFTKFILGWSEGRMFDQIILERSGSTKWIHIGLYSSRGEQRRQIKSINA